MNKTQILNYFRDNSRASATIFRADMNDVIVFPGVIADEVDNIEVFEVSQEDREYGDQSRYVVLRLALGGDELFLKFDGYVDSYGENPSFSTVYQVNAEPVQAWKYSRV